MNDADLLARLTELERRVSALEGRQLPQAAQEDERFWALNRLEAEYPEGALLFAGHVQLPTGERWHWKELAHAPDMLASEWEGAAPLLAALGHPLRLAILRAVLQGKRNTTELQNDPALASGGKLYHHLRDLQAAGWLILQGRGQYTVPAEKVIPLLTILRASGGIEDA